MTAYNTLKTGSFFRKAAITIFCGITVVLMCFCPSGSVNSVPVKAADNAVIENSGDHELPVKFLQLPGISAKRLSSAQFRRPDHVSDLPLALFLRTIACQTTPFMVHDTPAVTKAIDLSTPARAGPHSFFRIISYSVFYLIDKEFC